MPTIITHTAVPLALGLGLGSKAIPRPLMWAGVAAAMLPDVDVIGLKLGIAYATDMGHRGITHSLMFALAVGVLAYLYASRLKARRWVAGLFIFAACASHGLLDMCTNGGLGIAYLWPFSHQRYFLPWQVIQVAPLSVHRVLSVRILTVALSELEWVWLPALLTASMLTMGRFVFTRRQVWKVRV